MNTREALNILFKEKMSLSSEIINLKNSNNRILSKDVKSKMDIPPFSVSSMDGFAVRKKGIGILLAWHKYYRKHHGYGSIVFLNVKNHAVVSMEERNWSSMLGQE